MTQLSSDDRHAIGELLARYCFAIDYGRWSEFGAFFTEGCTLDFGKLMGTFTGQEGIARFAETLKASGVFMRHYTTNVVIRGDGGDGDGAHAESYVLAMTGAPGNLSQTTGRYEDDLVKIDGRWRIHVRRAVIELPGSER
ncbi:MAG: nuclear transport factor 2 family protein [Deltaproteobacteria bacterium]|nr:MAG: nuclear transport factor 2 family protein [Deltaproteobacteria bacterium]